MESRNSVLLAVIDESEDFRLFGVKLREFHD